MPTSARVVKIEWDRYLLTPHPISFLYLFQFKYVTEYFELLPEIAMCDMINLSGHQIPDPGHHNFKDLLFVHLLFPGKKETMGISLPKNLSLQTYHTRIPGQLMKFAQ